ncbi:hypothetical protein [Deinococcus hopiensis]|uniref:Uncharacterized protein n=1 Tax=Deinococcus hopiensis KR-140 TaxID=695939 RepID=A0A1W1UIV3_9DEIO|nr:hypothetical protein [Deinococcus hopiensis]SMB81055.1 hypothetical protein SAMN00790413_04450 [Deinococcus hopiensis KR-140]
MDAAIGAAAVPPDRLNALKLQFLGGSREMRRGDAALIRGPQPDLKRAWPLRTHRLEFNFWQRDAVGLKGLVDEGLHLHKVLARARALRAFVIIKE